MRDISGIGMTFLDSVKKGSQSWMSRMPGHFGSMSFGFSFRILMREKRRIFIMNLGKD